MKRVILFLVFATLLSPGAFAQDSTRAEKVDIRALVQKQIENARKNTSKTPEKADFSEETVPQPQKEKISEKDENIQIAESSDEELAEIALFLENTKKNIWTKLTKLSPFKRRLLPYFIALELFLIGIILAVWFTSRRTSANGRKNNLRETVKKMREEKLIARTNSEISKLRSGLMANAIRVDDGGKELVRFAKKTGISKGEILLAMKVRILSNMHK